MKNVLISTDQSIIALDLKHILIGNKFSVIGPAKSIKDIKNLIAKEKPNLIIHDLDSRFSKTVLNIYFEMNIPLLFLDSAPPELTRLEIDLNKCTIVTKPFTSEDILRVISTL
jgi:two-component SAPR family response regulator